MGAAFLLWLGFKTLLAEPPALASPSGGEKAGSNVAPPSSRSA
ncbi:MAG: hypothetical protein O3A06_10595 [Proteobacteria bacterium]|nr:hypothetical protein [Pseudomonadota bacterium]